MRRILIVLPSCQPMSLPFEIAVVLQEEAKAKAAAAAARPSQPNEGKKTRIKVTDIVDSDYPVIKSLTQFNQARRFEVVTVESMDDSVWEKLHAKFKEGMPFILRPKRGKTLLKIMGVSWLPQGEGSESL